MSLTALSGLSGLSSIFGGSIFNPLSLNPSLWLKADAGVVSGGARQFTKANSEYFSLADNAALSVGDLDFWVSAWVYHDSLGGLNETIVAKRDVPASANLEYLLRFSSGSLKHEFYVGNDAGAFATATDPAAVSIEGWYFLLGWYDSADDKAHIRINHGTAYASSGTITPANGDGTFLMGGTGAGELLDGRIDSVAFGKSPPGGITAIIDAISSSLYNAGSGKTYADLTSAEKTAWGLVSFWDLNELSGNAVDRHGSNTLTDNNTVTAAQGKMEGAAQGDDPVTKQEDQSTNDRDASQSTASKRCTLDLAELNGLAAIAVDGTDDNLAIASAISLTGAFTIYCVGYRETSKKFIPVGGLVQSNTVQIWNDNVVYVAVPAGNVSAPYTGSNGLILMRCRRTSGNSVKFAATGMAEATLGTLSGTVAIDSIYGMNAATEFSDAGVKFGELVVVASDVLTDTPALDAAALAYFQDRYGVSI